jgi:hypothetical protein
MGKQTYLKTAEDIGAISPSTNLKGEEKYEEKPSVTGYY